MLARRPSPLEIHHGANLPHWRLAGATYAVTFRLADSIPAEVLRKWKAEREHTIRRAEAMGRPLTVYELARLDELHSERAERWLDAGYGSCALRESRVAALVAAAMHHFDGERYELFAWCVMPNHVHAVLCPGPQHELSMILLSWKGFTGNRANKLLARSGTFWQKESYDHIVRDKEDFEHQVKYVLDNPRKAGLLGWKWVWSKGSKIPVGSVERGRRTEDTGRKPGAT